MEFIDWADQYGIILLILPPHTTHRLQPLDVGLCQPLSTYYSIELNQMMNEMAGQVTMLKGFFWPIFKKAQDKAFTEGNIQSAFYKSGIWPVDGNHIIKTITRPTLTSPEKPSGLRTPKTSKAIRRFQLAYEKEPTKDKVKTLFTTTLHLSTQVACLQHENRGLFKAIDLQKKKGCQGIRLNLCGQPNKGIVDCYSPAQVVKAREYQKEKEAFKAAEEQAKLERKINRAANALKKQLEDEEKKKRAAEKKIKATEEKLVKELAVAAGKALKQPASTVIRAKKTAPTQQKALIKKRAPVKIAGRCKVVVPVEEAVVSGVAVTKTNSCTINLLQRFRQKH